MSTYLRLKNNKMLMVVFRAGMFHAKVLAETLAKTDAEDVENHKL